MSAVPQWFTAEVTRRLRKAKRVPGSLQHYACCPVPAHGDEHESLGIRPGDDVMLVYNCKAGCTPGEIRQALAALGVPEEFLGPYGTPAWEARRRAQATSEERRELERLRGELADLRSGIRSLLVSESNMARLKVRILSAVNDQDIPAGRKEYVAFAMEAGVSQPRAYEAWKSDPLARPKDQCVTQDHVVLTQPGEKRQASQVTRGDRIIEPRKSFPNREGQNSRTENSRTEKTGDEAA